VREQLPSLLLLLLSCSPQSAMKKGKLRFIELNIAFHVTEHYITENYISLHFLYYNLTHPFILHVTPLTY
jgi:hypothetical protein